MTSTLTFNPHVELRHGDGFRSGACRDRRPRGKQSQQTSKDYAAQISAVRSVFLPRPEQFEIALSRSDYAVLEERCRDWREETLRQVSEWACVDVKHTTIERCGGSERLATISDWAYQMSLPVGRSVKARKRRQNGFGEPCERTIGSLCKEDLPIYRPVRLDVIKVGKS